MKYSSLDNLAETLSFCQGSKIISSSNLDIFYTATLYLYTCTDSLFICRIQIADDDKSRFQSVR